MALNKYRTMSWTPSKLRTPCNGDFFTPDSRGGLVYAGSSSRWTADYRIRIVMESLTTNITLAELWRKVQPETKRILQLETEIYRGWQVGINWFR